MEKIALPSDIQRTLLENYVKSKNLDWGQAAKEFNVGYSTLRYSYRTGRLRIPVYILKKLITDKEKLSAILKKYGVYNVVDKAKIPNNSSPKKAKASMIKKYGLKIFTKFAQRGAAVTNKMWTEERRIKQGDVGRRGGVKRIENAEFLTKQEKDLAKENIKLGLKFQSNYFLLPDVNFDFVYFKGNIPIAVEEATFSPFRSFTYFIEKRKLLDQKFGKNFPFLLTIKSTENSKHLIGMLTKLRIIVVNSLEDRAKVLKSNFNFKPEIKLNYRQTKAAEAELKRSMSFYEKLVDLALRELRLSPRGKNLLRKNNLSIVTDNNFALSGENVNVLVAYAKSRGSLFYQLYKNATYGYLIKNVFKEKVLTVTFDFSKTASSRSNNIPRKLCLKNCDYYAVTFKSDIESLKLALKDALGR